MTLDELEQETFLKKVEETYIKLTKSEFVGVKNSVCIDEIRQELQMGFDDFKDSLEIIYNSRQNQGRIELFGAPYTSVKEKERQGIRSYKIGKKCFLYIAIHSLEKLLEVG